MIQTNRNVTLQRQHQPWRPTTTSKASNDRTMVKEDWNREQDERERGKKLEMRMHLELQVCFFKSNKNSTNKYNRYNIYYDVDVDGTTTPQPHTNPTPTPTVTTTTSVLRSGSVRFFPNLGSNRNRNRLPYILNVRKVEPNRTQPVMCGSVSVYEST